jgi:hypothetical protein
MTPHYEHPGAVSFCWRMLRNLPGRQFVVKIFDPHA